MGIDDILLYICLRYPRPQELSKARLTKMVYLADWNSCVRNGRQLTSINWYFNNFGPYVEDVVEAAKRSPMLDVMETENFYGDPKQVIRVRPDAILPRLDRPTQEILEYIIDETKGLYWSDFIRYVYATKPIAESTRYSKLDLEKFARQAGNY
ncbi:hypothetical protein HD842_003723 [Massilia aurea]|jgi:hypothetical protein|uniref:Antitoxin SocA-like Panacea domain-containing protein n=1 Tax=Massilia aurea TaxID=373040 RepID=A0A7W9X317_9BURK|nr:Panacea domain-containing protein [Massilia aurea]MBB6135556.1 hypothetical protein [Massilia aurea]